MGGEVVEVLGRSSFAVLEGAWEERGDADGVVISDKVYIKERI